MTADMIRKEFLFSLGFNSDDETSFQRKKKTQVRYTLTEFKRQIDVYVIVIYPIFTLQYLFRLYK